MLLWREENFWMQLLSLMRAVDSWLRRKEGGLLCKLDIVKAFDHISWDFVLMVLKKIGFRSRWL